MRLALSEISFIPKTITMIKIIRMSNKINSCKMSCISKSNAKIEDKRLQILLNLPKI